MTRTTRVLFLVSLGITLAALVTWWLTGGDYYTKFEVVTQVERAVDPDDPLAGTGFYDAETEKTTETRKEFRLGLFPTATTVFDKHLLAVVSIVTPFWMLTAVLWWWGGRRGRNRQAHIR